MTMHTTFRYVDGTLNAKRKVGGRTFIRIEDCVGSLIKRLGNNTMQNRELLIDNSPNVRRTNTRRKRETRRLEM